MMMKIKYSLIVVLLLLISACATSPTGRSQLMLVSEETAIHASKDAYVQMLQPLRDAGKIDTDPAVTKRVDEITERLIAQAIIMRPDTANWDWQMEVIDEPEVVNAWAMAGGKMAVYTGLIKQVEPTDSELAQVLGHEISHALANHQAEKMSMGILTSAAVVAAGIASDKPALAMTGAALAASLAITKPNSRTAESEADRIGVELAAKAGYDPRAAVTLWQKMAEVSGEGPPEFLSTHPAPSNRSATLEGLIPEMLPYYEQALLDKNLPTYNLTN